MPEDILDRIAERYGPIEARIAPPQEGEDDLFRIRLAGIDARLTSDAELDVSLTPFSLPGSSRDLLMEQRERNRRLLRPDDRGTDEPIGFLENIERGLVDIESKAPVLGTAVTIAENARHLERLNRLERFAKEGFESAEDIAQQQADMQAIEDFVAPQQEEARRGETFAAKVGSIAGGLPKTVGEFALAGGSIGGLGALTQSMAAENMTERLLQNKLTGKEEDPLKTLMKAEAGAAIEVATEKFVGELFGKVTGAAGRKIAATAVGRAAGRARPVKAVAEFLDTPAAKALKSLEKKGAFSGPIEEWGEERVGDVLRAGLNLDGSEEDLIERIKGAFPGATDQAAELVAFSLFPGARIGAGAIQSIHSKWTNPKRVAAWQEENPAAAEIIKTQPPTRKTFEAAFPGQKFSAAERAQVKEALMTQPESPAGTVETIAQTAAEVTDSGAAEQVAEEAAEAKAQEPVELQELNEEQPKQSPEIPMKPDESAQMFFGAPLTPLKEGIQKWFTSRGNIPEPVFQRMIQRDGKINATGKQIQQTLRRYDRAIKLNYKKGVPSEVVILQDRAMRGDNQAMNQLPQDLQDVIVEMRDEVDRMSDQLLELGMIEGDLANTIEENKGVYLHRSYRTFDDPVAWARQIPENIRNQGKSWIRQEFPELNDAQVENKMNQYIWAGQKNENMLGLAAKLGAKDLSIFKKRKDIPKALRDLMGEYIEPDINYAKSVQKMANVIENHKFLTDVREAGMGTIFFTPDAENIPPHTVPVAAEGNPSMEPLSGLHTYPEVAQALNEAYSSEAVNNATIRSLLYLNGIAKLSKTVGSVQTHVRNLLSNTEFAMRNGYLLPSSIGSMAKGANTALKAALADIGVDINNKRQWEDYTRRAIELGVTLESVKSGELRDTIKDVKGRGMTSFSQEIDRTEKKSLFKKTLGAFATAYQIEDDVWKLLSWEVEKDRYRKAHPEWSEDQVERHTAGLVRNLFPTYSLVPRAVKETRKIPFIAPFISFPAEVLRTGYNTAALAARELQDPRTRNIGAQRMAGMLMASTFWTGLALGSRFLFGISKKEDEDLRQLVMPEWSKNGTIMHLGKNDDGTFSYVDLSYVDADDYIRTPLKLLMQGEFTKAGKEFADPFIGEELFLGKLIDLARNTKATGAPVWNKADTVDDKLTKAALHLGESLEPGTARSLRRIAQGYAGKVNRYGQTLEGNKEFVAMAAGQRIETRDPQQALTFKIRQFKREFSEAASMLSRVATNRGTVTDQELTEAYEVSERSRMQAYTEMARSVQSAKDLGVDRKSIIRILRAQGVSKPDTRMLIMGKYMPRIPSEQWLRTIEKQISVLPGEGVGVDEIRRRRQLIRSTAIQSRRQAQ